MKPGRVIGGDEHDARVLAQQIVDEARAEAEVLRDAARGDAGQIRRDADQLARRIVQDARVEADRVRPRRDSQAGHDAAAAGAVDEVVGLVMRATVAGVGLGEIVEIERRDSRLAAEVVGFRGEQAVVLPLGDVAGVAPASRVWRTQAPLAIRCGEDLLGRVLDGIGAPIDDGPPLTGELWPVERPAPPALTRPPITAPQPTGVRALDAMLTLGRGQRAGVFGAAGAGKSALVGQIARGTSADVVVLCVVGERGRELADLVADELAPARQRAVVVAATRDAPPLVRSRALHTATAIAEWFRDRCGAAVVLLCDSLTHVARAQREAGLSAGEPPVRHGYPSSVFAMLPRLIERAGATPHGAITAIYSVAVGDDRDDPIADEARGLLDGHIVLDRQLALRGRFPPIDIVASASPMMERVVDAEHAAAAARIRESLAICEEHRDPTYPAIERLLWQRRGDVEDWDASISTLLTLAGPG